VAGGEANWLYEWVVKSPTDILTVKTKASKGPTLTSR
jgi:hypothetical protein